MIYFVNLILSLVASMFHKIVSKFNSTDTNDYLSSIFFQLFSQYPWRPVKKLKDVRKIQPSKKPVRFAMHTSSRPKCKRRK